MSAVEDVRPSGWDTVAHILDKEGLFHQLFDWPCVIQVYSLLFGLEVLADPKTRNLFLPASHVLLFDQYYELTTIDNSRYVAFVQPTLLVTAKGKWVQPDASHLVTQKGKKLNMRGIGTLFSFITYTKEKSNTHSIQVHGHTGQPLQLLKDCGSQKRHKTGEVKSRWWTNLMTLDGRKKKID